MKCNLLKEFENIIMKEKMNENVKEKLLGNLLKLKKEKVNLMVTGATGCGKSSTINALFGVEVAKVGTSVDPETMEIEKYELDNLVIWDTPGLGDGKEADNRHSKRMIDKLYEKDENGNLLIDLVLVILDGGSRDLGTSYELINNVIIPNLGENRENTPNSNNKKVHKKVDGVEILEEDKDKMIIRAEVKAGTKKQRTIKITASAGTKYEKYDTNTVVDFGDRKRKSSSKR